MPFIDEHLRDLESGQIVSNNLNKVTDSAPHKCKYFEPVRSDQLLSPNMLMIQNVILTLSIVLNGGPNVISI